MTQWYDDITIHKVPINEVAQILDTNILNGISREERTLRLGSCNSAPSQKLIPNVRKLWSSFSEALNNEYHAALIVAIIVGAMPIILKIDDVISIYTISFIAASLSINIIMLFGIYSAAQKLCEDITNEHKTKVVVDSIIEEIDVQSLVVGDVVILQEGQMVHADMRIVESCELWVDMSTLTGEADYQEKKNVADDIQHPLESKNLIFDGTFIVRGSGRAVVFATSHDTVMSKVQSYSTNNYSDRPKFKRTLKSVYFYRKTALWAFVMGIIMFVLSASLQDIPWFTTTRLVATIMVGTLPIGLQVGVAGLKCRTIHDLKSKINFKHKDYLSMLMDVTCLVFNKTDALTRGELSVSHIYLNGALFSHPWLDTERYHPKLPLECPGLSQLHRVLSVMVELIEESKQNPKSLETALLRFAQSLGPVKSIKDTFPRVTAVPRIRSRTKSFIHWDKDYEGYTAYLEGSPMAVLECCNQIQIFGQNVPMNSWKEQAENTCTELNTKFGENVVSFAYMPLDRERYPPGFDFDAYFYNGMQIPLTEFIYCGHLSLFDHPIPEAREAVSICRNAGIKVILVSSDSLYTTKSFAERIGLVDDEPYELNIENPVTNIIRGNEIESYTNDDWDYLNSKPGLAFWHITPTNKQELVRQLRLRKFVVAMVGSLTSDVPALREADIGVSCGDCEMVDQIANINIRNGGLSSLVEALSAASEIGECNRKGYLFTATHLYPEFIAFLLFITGVIPLAIRTMMALLVNLMTDYLLVVLLCWVKNPNVKSLPIRHELKSNRAWLVPPFLPYAARGLLVAAICLGAWWWTLASYGFPLKEITINRSGMEFGKNHQIEQDNDWSEANGQWYKYKDQYPSFHLYRIHAWAHAQTVFLTALVALQVCHSYSLHCHTRPGVGRLAFVLGMAAAIALVAVVIYIPGFDSIFGSTYLG